MAGTKISDAVLRGTLKGTESIPLVDTDLPKGRTTVANLKTYCAPNLSGYATKTEVQAKLDVNTYNQDKATFATKTELQGKQDTLVSGTNIKTINSQSLLGEGNIEITIEGGGITDAPSDGKLYGRKNAQWTEVVIPDPSNLATKNELSAKLDTATYNEEKATFALKTEIPDTSNLATKTELSAKVSGTGVTAIKAVSALPDPQEEGVLYIVTGEEM